MRTRAALTAVFALLAAVVPAAASDAAVVPGGDAVVVSGTVVADGAPVAGVRVSFETDPGSCWSGTGSADGFGTATTGPDGTFSMRAFPADLANGAWIGVGSCYSGTFTPDGGSVRYLSATIGGGTDPAAPPVYAEQVARSTLPELQASGPVTIALHRPGTVVVSGARGRFVSVDDLAGTQVAFVPTRVGDDLEFRDLVPGRYRLTAGTGPDVIRSPEVLVRSGARSSWDVPARSPALLSGRVTVEGRAPGHRVAIRMLDGQDRWTGTMRSQRDGRYRVHGLLPGVTRLIFGGTETSGSGEVGEAVTVRVPAYGDRLHHDVDLRRGGAVKVVVPGVALVKGIASAGVRLLDAHDRLVGGGGASSRSSTVAVGASSLPGGRYTLQISDGVRWTSRPVRIRPGRTIDVGTVEPTRPLPAVVGRIGGAGRAAVNAYERPGNEAGSAAVDGHGRYRLALLPGRYCLVVSMRGLEERCTDVHLTAAGARHDLRPVAEQAPGTIRAVITRSGMPLAHVRFGSLPGYDGTTDEHGVLTLRAAAGTYRVGDLLGAPPRRASGRTIAPLVWAPVTDGVLTVRAGRTTDVGTVAVELRG